MNHQHFHAAVSAARRGERLSAYRLMHQVLLEHPTHVAAWLWMSELVTDRASQRVCLERALALDPSSQVVQQRLELLRLHNLLATRRSDEPAERTPPPLKLGDYLVTLGIVTAAQMAQALRAQRVARTSGKRRPLGDILVRLGWLTPEQLVQALVQQQQEKVQPRSGQAPERLGEYLVNAGLITTDEFAAVLTQQVALRQRGGDMLLGELLVGGGYLTPEALEQVLERQRDDLLCCFNA